MTVNYLVPQSLSSARHCIQLQALIVAFWSYLMCASASCFLMCYLMMRLIAKIIYDVSDR